MTATDARPEVARLVVASVPSGHVYVHHLAPEDRDGPLRLADPHPDDPTRPAEQRWWPPVMLDASWVETHDFDLMHLQFGFDGRTPAELEALVAALRRTGRPLVQTVHDLRNPHHRDRAQHDAQLDVLVPAADQLITLTVGAADEIRRRWGREALVLPHPHVVPLDRAAALTAARPEAGSRPFRVGLHLKSLRPNTDPARILPALVATVRDLEAAVLQVNVHGDVMAGGAAPEHAALADELGRLAAAGAIDLRVHDYLSDDDLWTYLAGLDVSVLPYRFGTHSGWLEACRDVGTTVVAPSCGYYADQGPVLTYVSDEERYDAGSLVAALRTAHRDRPAWGVSADERRVQRRGVAVAHDLVYRAVTGA